MPALIYGFSLANLRALWYNALKKGGVRMYEKWLAANTERLTGKTVAVTGSTGGLGKPLCRYLAALGADLILVDRNASRSAAHKAALLADFPDCDITLVQADLADMQSVRQATEVLKSHPVDVFIHNAGAYSIPRRTCDTGFDNVFQINFVSPYYMICELLPLLRARGGRVMAVGSIAHNYAKTDPGDPDFATRRRASLVYGNAKRHLMFSLFALFQKERDVKLCITHPGITFTNITAHYPKPIFALIKHPMKVIFMRPAKAALSLLAGLFAECGECEWIGPRVCNVWGYPRKRVLKSATKDERDAIAARAEQIYLSLTRGTSAP